MKLLLVIVALVCCTLVCGQTSRTSRNNDAIHSSLSYNGETTDSECIKACTAAGMNQASLFYGSCYCTNNVQFGPPVTPDFAYSCIPGSVNRYCGGSFDTQADGQSGNYAAFLTITTCSNKEFVTDAMACQTCPNGRSSADNVCHCASGSYPLYDACVPCADPNALTCTSSASLTCKNSFSLIGNVCKCAPGSYLLNNACICEPDRLLAGNGHCACTASLAANAKGGCECPLYQHLVSGVCQTN
jgi:hypothetical protein